MKPPNYIRTIVEIDIGPNSAAPSWKDHVFEEQLRAALRSTFTFADGWPKVRTLLSTTVVEEDHG